MKFNTRSKKSKENLENTLERENHFGFKDPEEKESKISRKSKGFGEEDLKSLREPLTAARDGVREKMSRVLMGAHSPLI
jgi:hypothetical protein